MNPISMIRKYEEKALEARTRSEHLQLARMASEILEYYLNGLVMYWEMQIRRELLVAGEQGPENIVEYKKPKALQD